MIVLKSWSLQFDSSATHTESHTVQEYRKQPPSCILSSYSDFNLDKRLHMTFELLTHQTTCRISSRRQESLHAFLPLRREMRWCHHTGFHPSADIEYDLQSSSVHSLVVCFGTVDDACGIGQCSYTPPECPSTGCSRRNTFGSRSLLTCVRHVPHVTQRSVIVTFVHMLCSMPRSSVERIFDADSTFRRETPGLTNYRCHHVTE